MSLTPSLLFYGIRPLNFQFIVPPFCRGPSHSSLVCSVPPYCSISSFYHSVFGSLHKDLPLSLVVSVCDCTRFSLFLTFHKQAKCSTSTHGHVLIPYIFGPGSRHFPVTPDPCTFVHTCWPTTCTDTLLILCSPTNNRPLTPLVASKKITTLQKDTRLVPEVGWGSESRRELWTSTGVSVKVWTGTQEES